MSKKKKSKTDAPWYFNVDESGTITDTGSSEPDLNSDVYDDINVERIKTIEDLIDEVDQYTELQTYFQNLCSNELEEAADDLNNDGVSPERRKNAERLKKLLEQSTDDWNAWVKILGQDELQRLKDEIQNWLNEPVDWDAMESWPSDWSSQGRALSFFESMDADIVNALGVVIVEGDHPGSSYFAAELHASFEDANAAAKKLKLPFRFREQKT